MLHPKISIFLNNF